MIVVSRRFQRGLTLAEVLVAIMIAGLIVAFLVSASARAGRHDRLVRCEHNLKLLHAAQQGYFAGAAPDASLRGTELWNALADTSPPLLDAETLKCPVRAKPSAYACDYWGPSTDVTKMAADGFLGCDDPSNHTGKTLQGGYLLLKSGDIVLDRRELWKSALAPRGGCIR